ncbi:MAG: helix-turn-helix domain-containing protein, partial [Bacteroidetes bacterium]|nr:helix-turn-helix domain-containing protein [Bacteroidota bacterium]
KNESKNGSSLLNVNEASELIGYTKSTLYTKVSRNEIPYLKQGGLLRFNREDLSNWIQSGKNLTATEIDKKSTDYLIKNS